MKKIIDSIKLETFNHNQVIYNNAEQSENIYFIDKGEVKIYKTIYIPIKSDINLNA